MWEYSDRIMCSFCGEEASYDEDENEYRDHHQCRINNHVKEGKNKRAEKVAKDAMAPFYVALYSVDRCYGGPQEGGWWYDWTALEDVYKVWDWQSGLAKARKLIKEYDIGGKAQRYNMNGGPDYHIRIVYSPEHAEEYIARRRPHYC